MNCPACEALIKKQDTEVEIEDDFIDIVVTCSKCEKESFGRIEPKDLILLDD